MGKKSQITCITYRAHAPSDWKVILKRENKPKPVYLGTSVSIFCLLWAGVGDSHKSEGRKDLRHCSAGVISNCTVNRDTREKRGQESNGGFNQPCCLAYVLSFYLLFLPLSVFLREHWLCECSITERDLCGFQGRKEDTGGFLSEWIYLRRGINIMLVWPWLNPQFQILETFVCNRSVFYFLRFFFPIYSEWSKAWGGRKETFAQNTQPCILVQNVKEMPGRQTESTVEYIVNWSLLSNHCFLLHCT